MLVSNNSIRANCIWKITFDVQSGSDGPYPILSLVFIILAFKKVFFNGPTRPLFVYFCSFHMNKCSTNTINEKSIDGVLGTRTRGSRMVGADKSTELWQHRCNEMLGKMAHNNIDNFSHKSFSSSRFLLSFHLELDSIFHCQVCAVM